MTEEEIKTEEEATNTTWTMDDLVALTDEVQNGTLEFRDKEVKFQFCELVESEEPKFKPLSDRASEEEKMSYYSDIGSKRILAMLEKANEKNPEGPSITKEHWSLLPTTLRYQISNDIMGIEQESRENFQL
tara:strand:- start:1512 stop:1904 length:393 start_codon:yes stop_codon:yes gene_type:complete